MNEKQKKTLDKIGNLICDKTVGVLIKNQQLENDDEEFGSLVTLTHLQGKIFPLLDIIRQQ